MVELVYEGPDGLYQDEVAPYNDGDRKMKNGKTYSVPQEVAERLLFFDGWAKAGEVSATAETEKQAETGGKDVDDEALEYARGNNVNLAQIEGSGEEGRVLKEDVEKAVKGEDVDE